jgi:Recombinase zinc beta ribbon domain
MPHRAADGTLAGKPEAGLIASHFLNGFLVCPCGGAMTFTSKNGSTKSYYCSRRRARGSHFCSNNRGVPEAALDRAVMLALYKLIKNPKTLWRLYLERAERWKRERTLTVDVRTNLAAEEGKLVKKVERLIAAIEDGQPVGNTLKERQAELDAVRARLAEPEPPVASEDKFHATLRDHSKPILGWHPSSEQAPDIAQPRAAMRRSASAGLRLRRPSPAGLSRETAP